MIELLVFAGWVALWFWPRWSVLNKTGLILVFLMIPGACVALLLTPDFFRTVLVIWTGYLAAFLGLGSLFILWRTRADSDFAGQSGRPTGRWAPALAKSIPSVRRLFALFAAIVFVTMLVISPGSYGAALFLGATTVLGPAAMFGYAWLSVQAADFLTKAKS